MNRKQKSQIKSTINIYRIRDTYKFHKNRKLKTMIFTQKTCKVKNVTDKAL